MSLTAKSLVLDLLSTMPPRYPVRVGTLVEAAGIFGIGENSLRVALARLRARGLVESDERGLYRMGAAARAVNRQVRSWRHVEEEVCDWDGSWVAVHDGSPGDRGAAKRRATALRLAGFRSLTAPLLVRPNNRVGGIGAARKRLASLGLGEGALVFELSELDEKSDRRARGLWDPAELERGYDATCATLESSAGRLASLPQEAAMAEAFRLGGEAVRQIVLDPLLPAPIVDTDKRHALVEAMRRYDVVGRHYWKGWAGEAVELEQSPGDGSGLAAAALG